MRSCVKFRATSTTPFAILGADSIVADLAPVSAVSRVQVSLNTANIQRGKLGFNKSVSHQPAERRL